MMNVVAICMVLSSVGAAIVMSPETLTPTTAPEFNNPLYAAKDSAVDSIKMASEAARKTGEGIKNTVQSTADYPGHVAEVAQLKVGEVAQSVKQGSQVGLEKIGLANPVLTAAGSSFEQWESELQASQERMAALREAAEDSAMNTVTDARGAGGDFVGMRDEPRVQYSDIIKDKFANAYDATVGNTVEAIRDSAGNVAQSTQKQVSDNVEFVNDLAFRIAQSAQDYINAAGAKASGTAGSVYEYAAEGLKGAGKKAKNFVGVGKSPTYPELIKQAAEQAAEILKNRGKEAAVYLPNVGQGLSYTSPNLGENSSAGLLSTDGDYAGELKNSVGRYYKNEIDPRLSTQTTSDNWREEFLDKIGIKSEADLATNDVLIGNFQFLYSRGVIHKPLEFPSSDDKLEKEAGNSVGEQASEIILVTDEGVQETQIDTAEVMQDVDEFLDSQPGEPGQDRFDIKHVVSESKHDVENITAFNITPADSSADLWSTANRFSVAWLMSMLRAVHLFAFASVYGTSLWITFGSGYILSRAIPRHQFALVQSRVFPVYLNFIASGQTVCLVLYTILHPWFQIGSDEIYQHLDLWAILVATLTNLFYLEPRATKAMFEKMRIEKEEGKRRDGMTGVDSHEMIPEIAKINNNFRVSHSYSSLANLLSLMGMTWHLCHLSANLRV